MGKEANSNNNGETVIDYKPVAPASKKQKRIFWLVVIALVIILSIIVALFPHDFWRRFYANNQKAETVASISPVTAKNLLPKNNQHTKFSNSQERKTVIDPNEQSQFHNGAQSQVQASISNLDNIASEIKPSTVPQTEAPATPNTPSAVEVKLIETAAVHSAALWPIVRNIEASIYTCESFSAQLQKLNNFLIDTPNISNQLRLATVKFVALANNNQIYCYKQASKEYSKLISPLLTIYWKRYPATTLKEKAMRYLASFITFHNTALSLEKDQSTKANFDRYLAEIEHLIEQQALAVAIDHMQPLRNPPYKDVIYQFDQHLQQFNHTISALKEVQQELINDLKRPVLPAVREERA